MIVSEIDNFVKKFKNLWTSGYDAHLDINSHAGKAWIGLRLRLGEYPGGEPVYNHGNPHYGNRNGPSRQRRRFRRARDAAQANCEPEDDEKEATEANDITEEVKSDEPHKNIFIEGECVVTTAEVATCDPKDVENETSEANDVTEEVTTAEPHQNIIIDNECAVANEFSYDESENIPQIDGNVGLTEFKWRQSSLVYYKCDQCDFTSTLETNVQKHKNKKHKKKTIHNRSKQDRPNGLDYG